MVVMVPSCPSLLKDSKVKQGMAKRNTKGYPTRDGEAQPKFTLGDSGYRRVKDPAYVLAEGDALIL